MSKGSDSTTSSTRTFMQPAPKVDAPPKIRPRLAVKITKRNLPWLIVSVLALLSLFLFGQYHDAQHKLNAGNSSAASKQVNDVVTKVRKLVILPAKETPTVATVQNAAKLKNQSFFAGAQNGDKVLVYSREKLAILYRPAANQIVNMAPVNVTSNGTSNLSSQ